MMYCSQRPGAFIAGESQGGKNYRFEKLLLGPQSNLMQAALGSLTRRVTRENLPLMKVTMNGDSVTYYANHGQHVVVYKLAQGEILSVESENILAFTQDCDYSVRFIGCGIFSQKGLATSTLTGAGPNAYVAVLSDGNPIAMDNTDSHATISVDPDAVICWMSRPQDMAIRRSASDLSWKNLIGQASGESYAYEWSGNEPVCVLLQPCERSGGIRVGID